jgi:hypothetical protein
MDRRIEALSRSKLLPSTDVFEESVDGPGEVALECSERFLLRLPFGDPPGDVVTGWLVDPSLSDCDRVQRAVELAVDGSVESVALLLAGRCVEWSDAGELRELPVCLETVDARDFRDELCRREHAATGKP